MPEGPADRLGHYSCRWKLILKAIAAVHARSNNVAPILHSLKYSVDRVDKVGNNVFLEQRWS